MKKKCFFFVPQTKKKKKDFFECIVFTDHLSHCVLKFCNYHSVNQRESVGIKLNDINKKQVVGDWKNIQP